jgi:hypothetical protein
MLFKQAAQGDERAFMTAKNSSGTSITLGYAVVLAISGGASFDGTQAVLSASGTAANLPGFLGIATATIPNTSYGLIQIFGNTASVLVSNMGTSITFTVGDPLIPSTVAGALFSGAPTYAASGFGWVICSNPPANTLSQAAPLYVSGFVRCIK